MNTSQQYKYFAFISYNSKDTEWGKRVQRKLEHYRMPATLCHENGWKRTPIKPVFFAPTDIQPGDLTEEIKKRLRDSRNLIVICSPNSAQSEWVGKEIEYFHSIGRTKNIHFFIVDGEPHSGNPATECFNPIVKTLGLPEILGANIHEKIFRWPWMNKERAYVQLISKLLGVEFDTIWNRHKRLLIEKCCLWTIGILAIIAVIVGVWQWNRSVDVSIKLNDTSVENTNIPPMSEAVVTIYLDNETKSDTINTFEDLAIFTNIPRKNLGKETRIVIRCKDNHGHESFYSTDTIVYLSEHQALAVKRNPESYGEISFCIWDKDGKPVADKTIEIDGKKLTSDKDGYIKHYVPLQQQDTVYKVKVDGSSQEHMISTPCGEDDIICIE